MRKVTSIFVLYFGRIDDVHDLRDGSCRSDECARGGHHLQLECLGNGRLEEEVGQISAKRRSGSQRGDHQVRIIGWTVKGEFDTKAILFVCRDAGQF